MTWNDLARKIEGWTEEQRNNEVLLSVRGEVSEADRFEKLDLGNGFEEPILIGE